MKRFYDIVTMTDDLHLTTRTASRSGCSDPASSFVVGSTESEARGSTARQKLQAVMLEPPSWRIRYFETFLIAFFPSQMCQVYTWHSDEEKMAFKNVSK